MIDCSTSDPNSTVALAAELKARGVALADAPLGGTPAQAEEGKLSAMVGCDADGVAAHRAGDRAHGPPRPCASARPATGTSSNC